ncbi:MAG TPA: ABC transporter ATP-binding protein [Patescibacteria group bacterium]|jgi:ABC-type multidrug transport system fused ATPase/permease subunit|nr:ABC transporter ATP-binding protein [Patescibacteria group bacterium]
MKQSGLQQLNDATIPSSAKELLIRMVGPYKTKTFLFFFLTLIGILAWAASPVMIAMIVTELSKTHAANNYVWILVALYALLRILDEVFWRLAEFVLRSYKPQMIENVRLNLFSAVLKKPHSFFVNSSSGRIGHWVNQTTTTANEFVDITAWTAWGQSVGLIFSAGFLFTVHWSLAIIFIVWLVLLFIYNVHRGKKFSQMIAAQSDETSKAAGLVVDSVSNHVSVRIFGAQAQERHMLVTQQKHIIKNWRDSWGQNFITNLVKGQSAALVNGGALCLVIILFSHGVVQLGGIVLFIAYFGDASSSLWHLAWALDNYYRNFGTIQNALNGLQAEDERQVVTKQKLTSDKTVALELHNLSFAYPEQPDSLILDSLNLHIKPGEKIGVVGHSGAGKSTLVGLLLGFYEPTTGDILLNNQSSLEHGPSFIRSFSSFVPQDTNLFNRTVRENVVYARPKASEQGIIAALKQAQAYDFINKLPDKLDTVIGERGVKLSGGQRQRIAIARAILQNKPLLILDEATSALDSVSEQAIQKALHELMQDRTSIVIAHRLSTLRNLDRIIVLDGGKIVEQGEHQKLIDLNGIYADLWKRQKDGFVVD